MTQPISPKRIAELEAKVDLLVDALVPKPSEPSETVVKAKSALGRFGRSVKSVAVKPVEVVKDVAEKIGDEVEEKLDLRAARQAMKTQFATVGHGIREQRRQARESAKAAEEAAKAKTES